MLPNTDNQRKITTLRTAAGCVTFKINSLIKNYTLIINIIILLGKGNLIKVIFWLKTEQPSFTKAWWMRKEQHFVRYSTRNSDNICQWSLFQAPMANIGARFQGRGSIFKFVLKNYALRLPMIPPNKTQSGNSKVEEKEKEMLLIHSYKGLHELCTCIVLFIFYWYSWYSAEI